MLVTAGEGKAREGVKHDEKYFGLLGDGGGKSDNKFIEVLDVILWMMANLWYFQSDSLF